MSLDKYEQQFLSRNKKDKTKFKISLPALSALLNTDNIEMGRVIEIRAKELSGLSLALQLANDNSIASLLVDSDRTFDKSWYKNYDGLLLMGDPTYENILNFIQHTDDVKAIVFNTILSLLPIDSDYSKFEKFIEQVCNHCIIEQKTLIFINPYLDNTYDIISRYADLIIVNNRRTSIKKNEERLGYNLDSEVVKNTINFKLGKYELKFLYSEGVIS